MTALTMLALAAVSLTHAGSIERPDGPDGLSALARAGEKGYYAVSDREGALYPLSIDIDPKSGRPLGCRLSAPVRLEGVRDAEGCAWDTASETLWVSDESNASVREFDVRTGKALRSAPVPERQKRPRRNLSLEALALSEDGLSMWTANEETLPCDGERSSPKNSGTVRLTRFLRTDAAGEWKTAGEWAYATEPGAQAANPTGMNLCGVPSLLVLDNGRLLALEREISGFFFCWRLYLVDLKGADEISRVPSLAGAKFTPVSKKLLASGKERYSLLSENPRLANYEGMCFGPKLADGRRTVLMIADSGDGFSRPLIRSLVLGE